ncbi:MAG: ATP-binding protein [Anaerolineales bacterium]|nr:ATP-binding protein [Anaerolineales bacterium]
MDTNGILEKRQLPDEEFVALWDAIILDPSIKDRLLGQAILNYTMRSKVNRAAVPLHGVILLVGQPGTGKTSLARALAAQTSRLVRTANQFLFVEVEPHALASSALGRSQKAVTELLGGTIAEIAAVQPCIVLLDEVETLAADRSKLSLEANPIDVHRATDAVLAQLDQLAGRYPNLLFLATSNFPEAIDGAFLSRADLVVTLDLPTPEACYAILADTLRAMGQAFPKLDKLAKASTLNEAAQKCVGLDGRRIRKLVAAACTFDREVAIDPNRLTMAHIMRAIEHEQQELHKAKGNHQ